MDEATMKKWAEIQALIANMNAVLVRVEKMKLENIAYEAGQWPYGHSGDSFAECENELVMIAQKLREIG